MKSSVQQEVDARTHLAGSNQFEMMLFRLGEAPHSQNRELFGINVFKVREILVMPTITAISNAPKHVLGVANIRGQIIPVIDLPAVVGCNPKRGLAILIVTEFARSTQAFAVEEVDEIVRLDWNQIIPAEGSGVGGLITSIARLDGNTDQTRLAQILDVEQILRDVMPSDKDKVDKASVGPALTLPPGSVVLAADDSAVARSMIEQELKALGAPFVMTRTGKEAWERLQTLADEAAASGMTVRDKVALVLTDLEMPEMDGFTLTRNIKQDARFRGLPVVIHSSLTGKTNESHVKSVGADAYIAKFQADELAQTIRQALAK